MERWRQEKTPGWGWPIAIVVIVHLGLAFIPVEFRGAIDQEPTRVELAMVTPPTFDEPEPEPAPEPEPEPEPVVEPPPEPPPSEIVERPPPDPEPEPAPEPEPEPQPASSVQASEPTHSVDSSPVAVQDEPPPAESEVDHVDEDHVAEDHVDESEEEVAAVEPEPVPVVEPMDWAGYGRGMVRAVQEERNYPRMAERMGWEGTATVRITVGADGHLVGEPRILQSTNHEVLDEEALRMVKAAAPFGAFTAGTDREERPFVIPVQFRVDG